LTQYYNTDMMNVQMSGV